MNVSGLELYELHSMVKLTCSTASRCYELASDFTMCGLRQL